MREGPILGAFIILFDYNDLLSGMASLEDDSNLREVVKGEALWTPVRANHTDLCWLVNYTQ
jgi:hypothetical protein